MQTMTYADHLKTLPREELISVWRGLCADIRQLRQTEGPGLTGEVAAANRKELERQLATVEKVGKRRRIIG